MLPRAHSWVLRQRREASGLADIDMHWLQCGHDLVNPQPIEGFSFVLVLEKKFLQAFSRANRQGKSLVYLGRYGVIQA